MAKCAVRNCDRDVETYNYVQATDGTDKVYVGIVHTNGAPEQWRAVEVTHQFDEMEQAINSAELIAPYKVLRNYGGRDGLTIFEVKHSEGLRRVLERAVAG